MSMNRRQFLQGAAAAAAAAGVASHASAEEAPAPKYSFEIPPEPIADVAATYEADVIVVGAGVSGLVTATTAVEEGHDAMGRGPSTSHTASTRTTAPE